MHSWLPLTNGTLTLVDARFQKTYSSASLGSTSRDYNSGPRAPILMLSVTRFIRHYWGSSCLASYPPLTYMLKFSRFVRLTSCHMQRALPPSHASNPGKRSSRLPIAYQDAAHPSHVACARGAPSLARKYISAVCHRQLGVITTKSTRANTEAGILSGMSQKHTARSSLY